MNISTILEYDPGAKIWRQRGHEGEPWTVVFGMYMACILAIAFPISWCLLYALWVFVGEKFGYGQILGQKKYGQLALRGALIGGIGAIVFPLSRWVQDRFYPNLPDYREVQEPLFGLFFHALIILITGVAYGIQLEWFT